MKRVISMLAILLLSVQLSGCALFDQAVDNVWRLFGREVVDDPMPEPPIDGVEERPAPRVCYQFGGEPFLVFSDTVTEKAYDGAFYTFNEVYGYDEPLSEEQFNAMEISIKYKEIIGGELFAFMDQFCYGREVELHARAVVINGEQKPYHFLYIRLYYPESESESMQREQNISDFSYDSDMILLNCDQTLIQDGYKIVWFSMGEGGEGLGNIRCVSAENGTFL